MSDITQPVSITSHRLFTLNGKYAVVIGYSDGSSDSQEFDSEDDATKYLTKKEADMAKDDKKNDNDINSDKNLDYQDPHTNAQGETHDTPERAASDMTPEQAEEINANVNPAPVPAGAQVDNVNVATNNLDADSENGSGNLEAPHNMQPSDKPNNGQQVQNDVKAG